MLQDLLGEQGPAPSRLRQLAQDRLELCFAHYNKGKKEKIKILCSAFVILPACSLAGEPARSWFTESAIAPLMLISLLGCSSENPAHPGAKIADKITYIQLFEKALQGNNLLAAEGWTTETLGSPFQPE